MGEIETSNMFFYQTHLPVIFKQSWRHGVVLGS